LSTQKKAVSPDRAKLLEKAVAAIYESSTMAVFFHTAIAEQLGIGATEEKTILILSGLGPLTAGEIAQQTGLTTAAVTNLIDRLESKGFVQRVRDVNDRRRVIVELDQTRLAELMQVFASLGGTFDNLLTVYNDDQLASIVDYLTRAALASKEAIVHLKQKSNAAK